MDKKPLIGVSILAVVLLVLGSLSNVVGYQSVQTSQQNIIKERIDQREVLFQTIVDIANNKEIQRIILKSQMSRGIFLTSELPIVTKTQIRQLYFLGLILSKVVSKSRILSLIGKYQFNNQEMQKEISTVIEKDTTLNSEITQLKDSECDCENEKEINGTFSLLCTILFFIFLPFLLIASSIVLFGMFLLYKSYFEGPLFLLGMVLFLSAGFVIEGIFFIGLIFNCWWLYI